jgi:hypothetical protein
MGYATEVGEGPGRGFNVNVGWAEKGVGDADYMSGAAGGGGGESRQAALRVTGVRDPAQTLHQSCLGCTQPGEEGWSRFKDSLCWWAAMCSVCV